MGYCLLKCIYLYIIFLELRSTRNRRAHNKLKSRFINAESALTTELAIKTYAYNARFRTRTRTNTNPNDTEANAAGRSALRKQSKSGVYHEGEGHWPKFSQRL